MYQKILAAVNEHLNSEISARYALHLAKICGATLDLIFVAEEKLSRSGQDRAEDALRRLFGEAQRSGVPVERIVTTGDPVKKIDAIVRAEKIQLVFAATRREDVEKRFYAGTIARNLSLHLPCSVALVRGVRTGPVHPTRIFVPLKARMDHAGERAFFVAKMAEAFHSRVFLFHAPRQVPWLFRPRVERVPWEWESRFPKGMAAFLELLRRHGIEHEGRIMPGAVGKSITVEASAKRHDLIVMGASQRSLWASFLRGNPVEDVLRETPCDLIILNPKHEN